MRKLKLLASNFSTVFAVLQGLPGSLPWGVLLTFLNDFLSQHKGMSIAQATLVRACCCGILLRLSAETSWNASTLWSASRFFCARTCQEALIALPCHIRTSSG